jgi:hypothetical protein
LLVQFERERLCDVRQLFEEDYVQLEDSFRLGKLSNLRLLYRRLYNVCRRVLSRRLYTVCRRVLSRRLYTVCRRVLFRRLRPLLDFIRLVGKVVIDRLDDVLEMLGLKLLRHFKVELRERMELWAVFNLGRRRSNLVGHGSGLRLGLGSGYFRRRRRLRLRLDNWLRLRRDRWLGLRLLLGLLRGLLTAVRYGRLVVVFSCR